MAISKKNAFPSTVVILNIVCSAVFLSACAKSGDGASAASPAPTTSTSSAKTETELLAAPVVTPEQVPQGPSYSEFMNDPKRASEKYEYNLVRATGVSTQWVHCSEKLDCVDKLVTVSSSVGNCTGVLIKSDEVLTNKHCVEALIEGSTFNSPIIVSSALPKANSKKMPSTETVARIRNLSPEPYRADGQRPDWAVLVLDRALENVKPAKANFGGFINGESYFTYGLSPYADAKDRLGVVKQECKAIYENTIAPNFNSPYYPVIKLANCAIGPGNSGSPIYNRAGELVGLIGGQLSPNTIRSLSMLALGSLHNTDDPFENVGWGTNLACMSVVLDSTKPVPSECDAGFTAKPKAAPYLAGVEEHLRELLQPLAKTDERFGYAIQRANQVSSPVNFITQGLMIRIPECVQKTAIDSAGTTPFEMQYAAPKMSPQWELKSDVTPVLHLQTDLVFDAEKLKTAGKTDLKISIAGHVLHESKIALCP